jgi:two-component system cell cycle sensor histidine kinase/response regulator CckA
MSAPPAIANEARRLEQLRQYDLLDTMPEEALDDLTALVGHICEVPISLISLVDEHRQWFKANNGLPFGESPRDISFCGHAIAGAGLLIVPDATRDERFADSPLVTGETHVRFYAGAPLISADGFTLGTLCVMDRVPRQLLPTQEEALRVLSRQVMVQLDLRRQALELAESEAQLFEVFRNCPVGVAVQRWSDRTFVDVNAAFTTLFGWERDEVLGRTAHELNVIVPDAAAPVRATTERSLRDEEVVAHTRWGEVRHVIVGSVFIVLRKETHTVTTFVDITSRTREEGAANRLAAIVESSDDAIIGKDIEGTITSWNRGAAAIFGYSSREMVGTSIMRLIPGDRHEEETHILTRIRRGESVEHFETLRQTKEGRLIDVSVTASPIRNVLGQVVGVSKVARDITAQKLAEGNLREREEQLRLYAEHSPAAIAMLDRDMRYLVVSQRWMDSFGLGEQSIVGRAHYDVFPDLAPHRIAAHKRCLAGAVERFEEDPLTRVDGSIDWLNWEMRPWHQADGSIGGIIIFAEDVSERRLADAALRESEERMRFALENAEIGIWDVDYRTRVIRWSPTLEAQYGLAPGAFTGTFEEYERRVHPEDRALLFESVRAAELSGADFSVLNRAVWPDGTVRMLRGAGRIHRDASGMPVRGVGISMDLTAQRSLEEQYQQAQKMEAVGRLAGGVAHDFNNLLTVILGYCELLLLGLATDDESRADVEEIQRAGLQASRLTRQLLAFSRKQIIEPTLLDFNEIAVELKSMLGRLIGEDVEISLLLHSDVCCVVADRGQIEQIVMNLAVNARDAMPDGGTLTIATTHVELDEDYARAHPGVLAGDYVALSVADTGTGMTPEVRARLFEPFFTTKEVGKGTGLGMATVYGIVSRYGGSIDVSSELGCGSTFVVYFPKAEATDEVVAAPAPVARPSRTTLTVLVVEDADGLRGLARRLLEHLGHAVLVAAGAAEAVRVFDENTSIDIVLTDVVLSGASGPELARQLMERRPELKVIYMSGYTEDAIVHHGILKPGISFLHKPFTSESLEEKIRHAI